MSRRQPDERRRLDTAHHLREAGAVPAVHLAVVAREHPLLRRQFRARAHQQAVDVEDPEPCRGLVLGQALLDHGRPDHVGDTDGGRPRAQDHQALLGQRSAGHVRGGGQGAERDGRRALDVVVEGEQPVPVAGEDRVRVGGGEVLPLEQRAGQLRLHRRDERLDHLVVIGAGQPAGAPAEVARVAEQVLVVRADVQQDRQGAGGVDATDRRVEAELADRDAHPADALVAQAEDALPVGDDDDVHVLVAVRAVAQDVPEAVPVLPRQEQPARPPVDLAETLAGLTHRRRVDDGQQFLQVLGHQTVEEHLVGVLELTQVDVPVEGLVVAVERLVGAADPLVQGLHGGRQQPVETELGALLPTEGGALVDERVGQGCEGGTGACGCAGSGPWGDAFPGLTGSCRRLALFGRRAVPVPGAPMSSGAAPGLPLLRLPSPNNPAPARGRFSPGCVGGASTPSRAGRPDPHPPLVDAS
ncbi:hypothetical protein SVIOM74S_07327 [Streptomyces violarus]